MVAWGLRSVNQDKRQWMDNWFNIELSFRYIYGPSKEYPMPLSKQGTDLLKRGTHFWVQNKLEFSITGF